MLAEPNDHTAQGTAGGGLQNPGAARDLEDALGHDEGRRGIDEEGGDLLVGEIVGDRHDLAGGDDDLFLPVAAPPTVEDRDPPAGFKPA